MSADAPDMRSVIIETAADAFAADGYAATTIDDLATKGTFHAKKGSIKDRNGMDLTDAEDIKKRWQEYTEELYKNIFRTQIITVV